MTSLLALVYPWSTAQAAPEILSRAPGDILLDIAEYLPTPADVLHLGQTCKQIFAHITPVLNRTVTLDTREQCLHTLNSFYASPALGAHVQTLVVRPDADPGGAVAAAVMLATPHLRALSTFVWDADERPAHDHVWHVLRMLCPLLRHVGCSVGAALPPPHSKLYQLRDLRGFALHLTPAFYREHARAFWPEEQPHVQFAELWAMLARCPDLERLAITGASTEPAEMPALLQHRWPRLRTLVLGDVAVQPQLLSLPMEDANVPFVDFLLAHPALESLEIGSRTGVPGWHLALLNRQERPLPNLTEFAGTLDHAAHLPASVQAQLGALRIREPVHLREMTPLHLSGTLRRLPALRALSLAVVLHASYDHGGVLRALVSGAPQLAELELVCAAKPCFLLETVARVLRPLARLRALHLALVTVPGEEPALAGAARMARANARLQRFTLTRLPRWAPLPLRLAPARWAGAKDELLLPRAPVAQLGALSSTTHALVRDAHGLPVRLDVHECRCAARVRVPMPAALSAVPGAARLAGASVPLRRWLAQWLARGGPRRYTHDLRPAGHPGLPRKRWAELLLRDGSAAGEEARLLLFGALLGAVAAWTFVSCCTTAR